MRTLKGSLPFAWREKSSAWGKALRKCWGMWIAQSGQWVACVGGAGERKAWTGRQWPYRGWLQMPSQGISAIHLSNHPSNHSFIEEKLSMLTAGAGETAINLGGGGGWEVCRFLSRGCCRSWWEEQLGSCEEWTWDVLKEYWDHQWIDWMGVVKKWWTGLVAHSGLGDHEDAEPFALSRDHHRFSS